MHIAISGASGFIGQAVTAALLGEGHRVTAVVRPGSEARTAAVFGDAVVVTGIDLACPGADLHERLGQPDGFVHLAWGALSDFNSADHLAIELPLHLAFLTALVRSGVSSVTVTGTCLEYGLQSGPLHEGLPTNPVTPYGLAKDSLRRSLQLLQRDVPFDLAWARLFYVYSDKAVRRTLLTQLSEAVARGDASFAMSLGEQLRDYLPADEQAALIARLAVAPGDSGVVNICSGSPISVRRLVEGWIAERGWKIALDLGKIFQILRQQDPALLIRRYFYRPGKIKAVKSTRLLLGKRHGFEFTFLCPPFFFGKHKEAFIQAAGNIELFYKICFG